MADAKFYSLDGTWHPSVHRKPSALHMMDANGNASCDLRLALFDDGGFTEEEALAAGRTVCKTCLQERRNG